MEHGHAHAPYPACPDGVWTPERVRALLRYRIERNEQNCEELADLLDTLSGAARKELLAAIGSFEVAGVQLRETLDRLEREKAGSDDCIS